MKQDKQSTAPARKKPMIKMEELRKRINQKLADKVPPGWHTAAEWAQAWDTSKTGTSELLKQGVESGLMELGAWRGFHGNTVRKVNYYREKPQ